MTWSYNEALTSSIDKVRFLVGDTDESDPQFQDEEIAWALTVSSDVYMAAIIVCRAAIARYSRQVSKSVGDLSISASEKAQHYRDLVSDLEQQAAMTALVPIPYAGGRTISDMETDETDADLVQPAFRRDQFTSPSVGGSMFTRGFP